MHKPLLSIALFFLVVVSFAQKFSPNEAESKVSFVIKNFGLKVDGNFKGIRGTILFDPADLYNSAVYVSVSANTIDTDNSTRDKHLKKADYFNVEKFPIISFISTKISKTATVGKYIISGNLTIKGTTKPIEFDFTAIPINTGFTFKGAFTINRRDFNVGGSSLALSDNLTVYLNVASIKN